MSVSPFQAPEVDSAALQAIIGRFRDHHALRIQRTGARLLDRHRRVLEALPMLYHRNHPALPGYVGPDVPHGIANYRPSVSQQQALRRVARTYLEPRLPPSRAHLQAMFLMGSGGTVGQGRASDIDLWVCCDTLLHSSLWPKVRMIEQWAAELGLELHTFLVDPEVLRSRRRLPGSRIPLLVLDEFYRSGALMAGRYPIWWLVAEDDPERYAATAERLTQQRFVRPDQMVDFGPVGPLPVDELAHAALMELDRSLTTPHKSLLKLKLMQAYALAPQLGPVSSAYRSRIHAGDSHPLRLDSYLLLYDHVERFLQSSGGDGELAFARALLIGKTAESIPAQPEARARSPEASALLERFLGWGFDAAHVARFRDLDGWSMTERLTEHRRIISALEDGVRLVQLLVQRTVREVTGTTAVPAPAAPPTDPSAGASSDHRQLHWLNEVRLDQVREAVRRMQPQHATDIATLHPALVSRRKPLTLHLARQQRDWLVSEAGRPVRTCQRLVEAVTWTRLNGARLVPARPDTPVGPLLAQVYQGFAQPADSYAFVNVEPGERRHPPRPAGRHGGTADDAPALLQLRSDLRGYSGFHQMHLQSLDLVSRDGSGHWHLQSLTDNRALLEGLGRLFACPPDQVCWHVPGGQDRFLLAHRLQQLHGLASRVLDTSGAMFVFPFGTGSVTIRRSAEGVETRRHGSIGELLAHVRAHRCSMIGVDPASRKLKAFPPAR